MSQPARASNSSYPPPPNDPKERMRIYLSNRLRFPADQWLSYAGQWVAMSWDGLTILAAAPDLDTLFRNLDQAGVNQQYVGFAFVEEGAGSETGGAGLLIETIEDPQRPA